MWECEMVAFQRRDECINGESLGTKKEMNGSFVWDEGEHENTAGV
jgi:hypothetical protein